jgi:hypothetical protein
MKWCVLDIIRSKTAIWVITIFNMIMIVIFLVKFVIVIVIIIISSSSIMLSHAQVVQMEY